MYYPLAAVSDPFERPRTCEPSRHGVVERPIKMGAVRGDPGLDTGRCRVVLGRTHVDTADHPIALQDGVGEASAFNEFAGVTVEIGQVGIKTHPGLRRPSAEAGRRADML